MCVFFFVGLREKRALEQEIVEEIHESDAEEEMVIADDE